MTQNIFDDPAFLSAYLDLRLNPVGHNELIEKPAIYSLLPNLKGKRILDLGCGHGDFSRFAASQDAKKVTGIDISSKMLEIANRNTASPSCIDYIQADMQSYTTSDESYDLVFSSLAIHYVENYDKLVQNVSRWLSRRGKFIFSIEHPIMTAQPTAWEVNERGERLFWRLDCYANEGKRVVNWLVPGVEKYHRKIETYIMILVQQGFHLDAVLEPQPDRETLKKNQSLSYESKRPPYLVISSTSTK